jgi:signal transduction histidine kinase
VDLGAQLRVTANLLAADPVLGGVEVRLDGEAPPVAADAELVKIVLQNLVINAAQAMNGRGTIRATLRPVETACCLSIADEGPGIPAEIRDRVFQPFVTTKARGTGLGLATAKRLIEAQAGTIAAECPPEGGTVVTIALPYA